MFELRIANTVEAVSQSLNLVTLTPLPKTTTMESWGELYYWQHLMHLCCHIPAGC